MQAYATAIKAFSKWAWRDGRTADYALNALVKPSDPTDRRRIRRVLTDAELRRLIEMTRMAPTWRGVSGLDRSMTYLIASLTGFRRDELLSLTPASFRLDARPPVAVCEAGYTKNSEQAEQPLPASCLPTLRAWLASKPARRPVFEGVPRARTGMMLKLDLARAEIPFETHDGVIDLHSLRHGYISSLARSGVPVKTLQVLARHADPRLTMNTYAHASLFDTNGAVESLPDLLQSPQKPQANAATGTCGPISHPLPAGLTGSDSQDPGNPGAEGPSISERLSHHFPTAGDLSRLEPSSAGEMGDAPPSGAKNTKPLISQGFVASSLELTRPVVRVADGIRTRDIQIHNLVP